MSSKKRQNSEETRRLLKDALIKYVSDKGKRPGFVFRMIDHAGIVGVNFYDHFESLKELESLIWQELFEETINRLNSEPIYSEYSAREKLLAFYFTLIEVLKEQEDFSRVYLKKVSYLPGNSFLSKAKKVYVHYLMGIISLGKQNDEVVERLMLSDYYDQVIWYQLLFVLKFWASDESEDYQKTDAAIEKAVNTLFDFMGKTPIDSLFDFGKFLVQNTKTRFFI